MLLKHFTHVKYTSGVCENCGNGSNISVVTDYRITTLALVSHWLTPNHKIAQLSNIQHNKASTLILLQSLLLPLSKKGLQILLQWQSGRSHRFHFLRLIAAAGCRLCEPDRNDNTMCHQYSTCIPWLFSEGVVTVTVSACVFHCTVRNSGGNFLNLHLPLLRMWCKLRFTLSGGRDETTDLQLGLPLTMAAIMIIWLFRL